MKELEPWIPADSTLRNSLPWGLETFLVQGGMSSTVYYPAGVPLKPPRQNQVQGRLPAGSPATGRLPGSGPQAAGSPGPEGGASA